MGGGTHSRQRKVPRICLTMSGLDHLISSKNLNAFWFQTMPIIDDFGACERLKVSPTTSEISFDTVNRDRSYVTPEAGISRSGEARRHNIIDRHY